jgi:hypothetical protein
VGTGGLCLGRKDKAVLGLHRSHGIYGLYAYMSSTFLTFLLLTIYVCREKTFLLITHNLYLIYIKIKEG